MDDRKQILTLKWLIIIREDRNFTSLLVTDVFINYDYLQ